MTNKIWKFLNSNLFLLILGFVLTSVLGTFLSDRLQERSWQKEKKFEILKIKLEEGQNSLEEISDLINRRFYRLQNVYIFIVQGDKVNAERSWAEYIEVVEEWNAKLIINQNKIRRLVNDEEALKFNNYETDNLNNNDPISIHGKFYVVHQEILDLLRCLKREKCSITKEQKDKVNKMLRDLDYVTDNFIDNISTIFLQRTIELESLDERQIKIHGRIGTWQRRMEPFIEKTD
jgi:hypothetical protein